MATFILVTQHLIVRASLWFTVDKNIISFTFAVHLKKKKSNLKVTTYTTVLFVCLLLLHINSRVTISLSKIKKNNKPLLQLIYGNCVFMNGLADGSDNWIVQYIEVGCDDPGAALTEHVCFMSFCILVFIVSTCFSSTLPSSFM